MSRSRTFLFATALVLAAATNSYAAPETVHRTFNVADGGTLRVDSDLGNVRVLTGASGNVSIDVTRRGTTARVNAYAVTFNQQQSDVIVHGKYEEPTGRWHWSDHFDVDYEIRVPQHFNVVLKTSGGDIHVGNLQGSADVQTSGGEIELGRISGNVKAETSGGDAAIIAAGGALEIKTSGGSIRVGDAARTVDARTSGGSVEVTRAGGDVKIHTSGGSITIDEALGAIDAVTSGGSIAAKMTRQPSGDSRMSTSGGGVTVSFGSSVAVDLDAHTSGGDIDSSVPLTVLGTQSDGSLSGKMNGGGPRLVLRASGGDIRLRKL
jgi:DUF4097 and DUF4098 domain-containing protein YvlB